MCCSLNRECCSPNRFAVRAATYFHTRAWQTLIYGKECFTLLFNRVCADLEKLWKNRVCFEKSWNLENKDFLMETIQNQRPYGPRREKTCLPGFANNKGADQSAPLLFTLWSVSYLSLPQVIFQLSICL